MRLVATVKDNNATTIFIDSNTPYVERINALMALKSAIDEHLQLECRALIDNAPSALCETLATQDAA